MATPTIPNGETQFFPIIYEGTGGGQRVGTFVPFTNNGTIANSVIFNDDDNAYLSRTNDAGDRDTFTISVWVKRGNLGSVQHIFDTYDGSSSNDGYIRFNADNTISTRIGSPSSHLYTTNRTFEDTSKWYHIMLSVNTGDSTAADRVKLYVDGDRITSFSTQTNAGSADDTQFNYSSATFRIGSTTGGSYDLDAYLAEFNQVDGTALTPDTFGITDTSSGRWVPKALTGITYGTNGFRLQFGSSSNLGDDTSGNTNDFSVSNLVAGDQTTDSPTQNFATFDPLDSGNNAGATPGTAVLAEGNTRVTAPSNPSNWDQYRTSKPLISGKYYVEVTLTSLNTATYFGVISKLQNIKGGGWYSDQKTGWTYDSSNGTIENNNSGYLSYGSARSQGDVVGIAVDLDNGKLWFSENGTYPNSGNPATGANPAFSNLEFAVQDGGLCFTEARGYSGHNDWNFGQKSYTHSAPSGFSTVQQDNMPETSKGVSGLSWVKDRDSGSLNHALFDSSRGPLKYLNSNTDGAEGTGADTLTKFLKGGFATEDGLFINTSGDSYVAWNWIANGGTTASNGSGAITSTVQANTTAGFSIVQYTGSGSSASIGHGLSKAPEVIWIKDRDNSSTNWRCWHTGFGNITTYQKLNSDDGYSSASMWGTPTASAIIVGGTGYEVNESGTDYVAYCWHGVDGFSKFGRYTGNNSADGPFIYTGFKPALVIVKGYTIGSSWIMMDSKRDPFNAGSELYLMANSSNAEAGSIAFDFLSNGFKCRDNATGLNGSYDYLYFAWAEHPFVGDGTNPVTAR